MDIGYVYFSTAYGYSLRFACCSVWVHVVSRIDSDTTACCRHWLSLMIHWPHEGQSVDLSAADSESLSTTKTMSPPPFLKLRWIHLTRHFQRNTNLLRVLSWSLLSPMSSQIRCYGPYRLKHRLWLSYSSHGRHLLQQEMWCEALPVEERQLLALITNRNNNLVPTRYTISIGNKNKILNKKNWKIKN